MEEINKEDIEQLKRDLYTYGYLTKKIENIQSNLYDISMRLKDREEAQGISYGEKLGSSDPYHPSTAALIYEEEGLQIKLKECVKKRSKLNFDDLEERLSLEEYEIISSHFFQNLPYSFISVNGGYPYEEKVKRISRKALKKILKKVQKCPTEHLHL